MKPFIPFPFPLPFLHFFPLLIPLLPQVLFLLPDFPRLLFAADADGFHDEEFSFVRMFHAGFALSILACSSGVIIKSSRPTFTKA